MSGRTVRIRSPWTRLLIFAVALALFLVSYQLGNRNRTPDESPSIAVIVSPPLDLPPFRLTDGQGNPFSTDDLSGSWTLMLFSPADESALRQGTERLAGVYNRLAAAPRLQAHLMLVPVMTSEPRPDESAREAPGPPWRLLTGPSAEVARLREKLGLQPSQVGSDTPRDQTDGLLLLIDPKVRLYGIYTADLAADAVAGDLERLTDRYDKADSQSDAQSR